MRFLIIILLEIPIDIGGALLLLWFFGGTINIMAAIGIVVMSGVIINDSILKLHTINMLRKEGHTINDAIKLGGKLRLKPILMTSLTTILALLPFLFMDGLGAKLQKPLALTVIGGMLIGTFISLYFIPLMYSILGPINSMPYMILVFFHGFIHFTYTTIIIEGLCHIYHVSKLFNTFNS